MSILVKGNSAKISKLVGRTIELSKYIELPEHLYIFISENITAPGIYHIVLLDSEDRLYFKVNSHPKHINTLLKPIKSCDDFIQDALGSLDVILAMIADELNLEPVCLMYSDTTGTSWFISLKEGSIVNAGLSDEGVGTYVLKNGKLKYSKDGKDCDYSYAKAFHEHRPDLVKIKDAQELDGEYNSYLKKVKCDTWLMVKNYRALKKAKKL